MTAAATVEIPKQVTVDGEQLWEALVRIGSVDSALTALARTDTPFTEILSAGLSWIVALAFAEEGTPENEALIDRLVDESHALGRTHLQLASQSLAQKDRGAR